MTFGIDHPSDSVLFVYMIGALRPSHKCQYDGTFPEIIMCLAQGNNRVPLVRLQRAIPRASL